MTTPTMTDGPVLRFTHCRVCGQAFNPFNTYSEAGWIETQVSGICEVCFDVLTDIPPLKNNDDSGGTPGRGAGGSNE